MIISLKHHPNRNIVSKESTENFQRILKAYHAAGGAFEDTVYEDDDKEDKTARKIFISSSPASPHLMRIQALSLSKQRNRFIPPGRKSSMPALVHLRN